MCLLNLSHSASIPLAIINTVIDLSPMGYMRFAQDGWWHSLVDS